MTHRSVWIGGLLTIGLAAAGCGGGKGASKASSPSTAAGSAAKEASAVSIKSFKFLPSKITVAVGAKVTWTNQDSAPHTASASDGKSFDTGTLKQGQSKTIALTKAGTYSYVCQFHPFMKATVVVR